MKCLVQIGILCVSFHLLGCEKDSIETCHQNDITYGPYFLDTNTRNLFPYDEADSMIIFKNNENEELIFKLILLTHDTMQSFFNNQCAFDSSIQLSIAQTFEIYQAHFLNDSLLWRLRLNISASGVIENNQTVGQADVADLFFFNGTDDRCSLTYVLDHKSGEPYLELSEFSSKLSLGGKTFTDVYSSIPLSSNSPDYQIFMNSDQGIVGIRDVLNSNLWVFDRVE